MIKEISKIESKLDEMKSKEVKKEEIIKPKMIEIPAHSVTPIPTGVEQKWNTTDGLPPRYIGGNLTPINAK